MGVKIILLALLGVALTTEPAHALDPWSDPSRPQSMLVNASLDTLRLEIGHAGVAAESFLSWSQCRQPNQGTLIWTDRVPGSPFLVKDEQLWNAYAFDTTFDTLSQIKWRSYWAVGTMLGGMLLTTRNFDSDPNIFLVYGFGFALGWVGWKIGGYTWPLVPKQWNTSIGWDRRLSLDSLRKTLPVCTTFGDQATALLTTPIDTALYQIRPMPTLRPGPIQPKSTVPLWIGAIIGASAGTAAAILLTPETQCDVYCIPLVVLTVPVGFFGGGSAGALAGSLIRDW